MKKTVSILLCLVIFSLACCVTAGADYKPGEFQIKIATVTSGSHPRVQMGEYMAKELNERYPYSRIEVLDSLSITGNRVRMETTDGKIVISKPEE